MNTTAVSPDTPLHRRRELKFANVKKLVDEFRARDMTSEDAQLLLDFSPSGARKYIRAMIDAGILLITGLVNPIARSRGSIQYHMVQDEAKISDFLMKFEFKQYKARQTKTGSRLMSELQSDSGRHVHLMHDDAYLCVRVNKVVPAADPCALPREFFRPSVQHDEPLPRVAREQSTAPAWPQPSDYKMEFAA